MNNGNVGIGSTSPANNFDVAGKVSEFNSNQDGSLGSWTTNSNSLPGTLRQESTVVANGYIYTLGGTLAGSPTANVYFAQIHGDGSIGPWTANPNPLPAVRLFHTSVVANGYVYVIGGRTAGGGTSVSTVYYAKLNADGSIGPWNTTTSLPFGGTKAASVVANGYVYVIGGDQNGTLQGSFEYAKLNADGTLGPWVTNATGVPDAGGIDAPSAVVANGYLYVIGGTSGTSGGTTSTVYYASINANGSIGSWSTTASLPTTLDKSAGAVVANGNIYQLGGFNGSNPISSVFYAKVQSNGTLGAWATNANSLPDTRDFAASTLANGYVYVLGGNNGVSDQSTVYYAPTARLELAGDLDLLGLTSGSASISNSSGTIGGSIFAGNIYSSNDLEVSGNTELWNGLSVNGPLSILGATSTVPSPLLNIASSTNRSILSVLSSGNVGIGTTTPYARLSVWGPDAASSTLAFNVVNSASSTVFAVFDGGNAQLSGTLTQSSDQRLKTNIQSLDASSTLALIDAAQSRHLQLDRPQRRQRHASRLHRPASAAAISRTGLDDQPHRAHARRHARPQLHRPHLPHRLRHPSPLHRRADPRPNRSPASPRIFVSQNITASQELCVDDTDGTPICVTGDQLASLCGAESGSGGVRATNPLPRPNRANPRRLITPKSVTQNSASSTREPTTPPTITINGDNPAIIQVGDSYD